MAVTGYTGKGGVREDLRCMYFFKSSTDFFIFSCRPLCFAFIRQQPNKYMWQHGGIVEFACSPCACVGSSECSCFPHYQNMYISSISSQHPCPWYWLRICRWSPGAAMWVKCRRQSSLYIVYMWLIKYLYMWCRLQLDKVRFHHFIIIKKMSVWLTLN